MKKDNSILLFGVFFSASILAEIYCIVEKINLIGVSVVVLIASYLVIDAIRNERNRQNEKQQNFYGDRLNEIEKIQKALYVQMKKSGGHPEGGLEALREEAKAGVDALMDSQLKSAKIIVKYLREDLEKAAIAAKESSGEIVAAVNVNMEKLLAEEKNSRLNSRMITGDLDSNFNRLIARMEERMNDIESEILKLKQGNFAAPAPDAFPKTRERVEAEPEPIMETAAEIPAMAEPDPEPVSMIMEEPEPADIMELEIAQESVQESAVPAVEAHPAEEELTEAKPQEVKDEVEKPQEAAPEEAKQEAKPVKPAEEPVDPNRPLSADEIAAMFATAGDTQETKEEIPAPSDTVMKPEEAANQKPAPEEAPKTKAPVKEELTAIEKLKAKEAKEPKKAESKSKEAKPPVKEAASVKRPAEPNGKEAGSAKRPAEPNVKEAAPAKPAEDPNRALSADEIAAMFASIGTESEEVKEDVKPEPEKAAQPAEPADPNKQLSADEIAALFASIG